MRTALFGLLLAAWAGAQTVEGTIVDSTSGNGLAAVQVFLMAAPEETPYSATTDRFGRFRFEVVQAGTYQFSYLLAGYLGSYPREVKIGAEGAAVKLEGRMTPQPRISGRVVDSDRQGIAHAVLQIIGENNPPVTTDATGNFELRLVPGAYILSVLPPSDRKPPDAEPGSGERLVWTRTFYPGVARLEAASKIVLYPGTEFSGIEIQLLAVPSHAVRGVLVNPDGTGAAKATVTLGEEENPVSGRPEFARDPARTLRAETNSDGTFEFPAVADGAWRLAADVENGGTKYRAAEWIDMAGRELEDVKLRLAAPFAVKGQVAVETPQGLRAPDPFRVFLVPQGRPIASDSGMANWRLWPVIHFESLIRENAPIQAEMTSNALVKELGAILATPDASGNFTLEGVYPGSYRIVSTPAPPPYYLAAIRAGGTELATAEVDLSTGTAPLTIVYKANGGTVRGTVEKCAAGIVILIPQDPALQSVGFLRAGRCDGGGRYEISAVRPGEYYALALAEPGGVPQLDDSLLSQASRVTARTDETVSTDLRAIQRPGH